ncbi:MAG: hypothetical protein FWG87_01845 [Defluviitaleaceae bacterium]|nr:hypothetical protein [Defluviitaleaceae bacterium]
MSGNFFNERLNAFAEKHNIIAGVCNAEPLTLPDKFVPFVKNTEKRTNPQLSLKGAQSIVVIGVANSPLVADDDYHVRVRGLSRQLAAELGVEEYKILVDSPALDERALAYRAGLGFYGRNGLIISKRFGSRFNIGCLLLRERLVFVKEATTQKDEGEGVACSRIAPSCLTSCSPNCPPDCNLCITACPTKALSEHGEFDVTKCVSYLTQKDTLTPQEEALVAIGGQLYGCEICQDVCPFNSKKSQSCGQINPQDWLLMSDEDFKEKYAHTAILWRGADILRRNAGILSG